MEIACEMFHRITTSYVKLFGINFSSFSGATMWVTKLADKGGAAVAAAKGEMKNKSRESCK